MKYLSTLLLAFFSLSGYAQKQVRLDELKEHIGDSVAVKGRVYGVRHLQTAKNSATFINVGAAYPNQLLALVIWGDVRKQLAYISDENIPTKSEITIFGNVEEYKGKPQITVRNSDQLVFKYDTEVPFDKILPIDKIKDR